ncbi:MAG: hypothetical protein K8F91_22780 [Candidatus Obscuribacterales bacterium]|nr:hypothetical protein [Candidatus Obscuribacterales bacterium]
MSEDEVPKISDQFSGAERENARPDNLGPDRQVKTDTYQELTKTPDDFSMQTINVNEIAEANKARNTFELFDPNRPDGDQTLASSKAGQRQIGDAQQQAEMLAAIQKTELPAKGMISIGDNNYPPDQLIAANVVPNVPNLEQMQEYEETQTDVPQGNLAQALEYDGRPPTLIINPTDLGLTPEVGKALNDAIGELLKVWTKDHPLADQESAIMADTTKRNPQAWENAKGLFPQLKDVSVDIMKAYTRNEIANYDRMDLKDDIDAARGSTGSLPGRPAERATLGISQISPKGVREFEERYPEFKKFLENKGYTGPGHEVAALLDPECAPIIVAAKTASIMEDMQKHGLEKPSLEQIAYSYNPDVYSFSDGRGGERTYKTMGHPEIELSKMMHPDQRKEYYANDPRVIAASAHIHNVMSHRH